MSHLIRQSQPASPWAHIIMSSNNLQSSSGVALPKHLSLREWINKIALVIIQNYKIKNEIFFLVLLFMVVICSDTDSRQAEDVTSFEFWQFEFCQYFRGRSTTDKLLFILIK